MSPYPGMKKMSVAEIIFAARQGGAWKCPKKALEQGGQHNNVEIKARCNDPDFVRTILRDMISTPMKVDRQLDTYLNCSEGRLKIREGNVENYIIHYRRSNQAGPKKSEVNLFPEPDWKLIKFLKESLGTKAVVDKRREIYFVGNVKFHLDMVEGLDGWFIEIEAIDLKGTLGVEMLEKQCKMYVELLKIQEEDLFTNSYSDMILDNTPPRKWFVEGMRAFEKMYRLEKLHGYGEHSVVANPYDIETMSREHHEWSRGWSCAQLNAFQ